MVYELSAPARLRAAITPPASKSLSGRALIIGALARSEHAPCNVSDCDDTRAMLAALAHPQGTVNVGAAGTAMRFLTAYFAGRRGEVTLTGSERMLRRPIGLLVDALRQLGAHIDYVGAEGYPPLHIAGAPLHGGRIELPADISSQYVSALLMVGPTLHEGLTLRLSGAVVSRPYIEMTVRLMQTFGAEVNCPDERTFVVAPRPYTARPYCIENDWSAASYWYEAMALTPDAEAQVSLAGLGAHSLQGDARVAELFAPLGVKTTYGPHGIALGKATAAPHAVLRLDLTNQPDLAQTLVCTCLALGRPFAFAGLSNLKIKETDRLAALRAEAAKLGFELTEGSDGSIAWSGKRCAPAERPVIATYQDHRMAMAFAPMCLRMDSLSIANPEVVSKSYPHFWEDLQKAGFGITPR